jgi:hypothetical protein
MRKQVTMFAKKASELQEGEQILNNRHSIVEVIGVQSFKYTIATNGSKRRMIEVMITTDDENRNELLIFSENEFVLSIE